MIQLWDRIVPIPLLYIILPNNIMNNNQLELLKKQYIMEKILASYFDERKRRELEALRNKINDMQAVSPSP